MDSQSLESHELRSQWYNYGLAYCCTYAVCLFLASFEYTMYLTVFTLHPIWLAPLAAEYAATQRALSDSRLRDVPRTGFKCAVIVVAAVAGGLVGAFFTQDYGALVVSLLLQCVLSCGLAPILHWAFGRLY